MFDSGSDSELNASTVTINMDSSAEAQVLAETRGEQLQEENAALIKQNNILKAQFDQAVKLTESMDKLHSENEKMKTQIRELTNEKQDLIRRLEISAKAQSEMSKKFDEEKNSTSIQREQDTQMMSKELKKTKKAFQEQVDSLYSQLKTLQEAKDQDDIAQKTLVGRIETLMENAVHYFNIDFQSFEDLCNFFQQQASKGFVVQQQQPIEAQKIEPVALTQQLDERTKEYEKKIKSLKAQFKAEVARNKELEDKIVAQENAAKNAAANHKVELDAINAKIAQMKEEHALADEDLKHQITILESKLAALKSEKKKPVVNAQKEEKPQQVQPKPQIIYVQQPQVQQQEKPKRSEDKDLNEQYIDRISELTKQVETVTKKYTAACEQIKQSEAKCGELLITLDKNESELSALKNVHKETVSEIETIRKALHAKDEQKDKKQEYQQKKEQQKQKAAFMNLEKNVEMLKKQNYEQQLEKEEIAHEISEKTAKIASLEQDVSDLKVANNKLKSELAEAAQRFEMKKVMTEEDFIPRSAWGCGDFDPSLAQALEKIGANGSLSAASKLQHIYKAIIKFYEAKVSACETALDESFQNSQKIETAMNDFLVSLTIALSDSAITLEDFFKQNAGSQIITSVSNLRAALVDEQRQAECLQAIVDTFVAHFGTNEAGDIISQIEAVRSEFEQKREQLLVRGKKCKVLKAELAAALSKISAIEGEYKHNEEQMTAQIEALTSANVNAQDTIKKLKVDLKKARDSLCEKEAVIEAAEKDAVEKEEEHKAEIESISEEIENKHLAIEAQLQKELEAANCIITENETQISRFKKAVAMQKTTIANRDSQIASLKEENESNIKSLSARAEIEKKQVIESYEKAIEEITAQCNAHRNDVEKLSVELTKSEKRVKDAKASVLKTKRESARLEKEIKAMEEQFSREKKLSESSLKNAIITAETTYAAKINEVKAKADDEKRKLIALAATEFSQFFNASETIDERSYKSLIIRAKDELERLSKSDGAIRRMVSASGRQTTDDAVAQLLMDLN